MGYSLWLNSCICLCLKRGNSKSTLDSSCYLLKSRAFEGLPGLPHFQSHSNQMILQETAMQSGTRESEKRVAATPASIKMLQNEGYKVAPRPMPWGSVARGILGRTDLRLNSLAIQLSSCGDRLSKLSNQIEDEHMFCAPLTHGEPCYFALGYSWCN